MSKYKNRKGFKIYYKIFTGCFIIIFSVILFILTIGIIFKGFSLPLVLSYCGLSLMGIVFKLFYSFFRNQALDMSINGNIILFTLMNDKTIEIDKSDVLEIRYSDSRYVLICRNGLKLSCLKYYFPLGAFKSIFKTDNRDVAIYIQLDDFPNAKKKHIFF